MIFATMAGSHQYEARRHSDGPGGAYQSGVTFSGPASLDAQLKELSKSPRPIRSGKVA